MKLVRRYSPIAMAFVFFSIISSSNKGYCLEGRISQVERAVIENAGFFGIGSSTHEKGIIIDYLSPDGPAAKAGFIIGDVITTVDNLQIDNKEKFVDFTNTTKAEQQVTVKFLRDNKPQELTITLDPLSPATIQYKLWAKLGQSWRDKAREAFARKDFNKAIECYEVWLNADPHDKTSWYNLACTFALNGNKESALDAWEYAIDAGWDDAERASEDEDLQLIWSEQRFTQGLERCVKNQHLYDPKDYERNYLEMKSLGTYIAMLPPDYEESANAYPLCLILHGSGSSEIGHGDLSDRLGRNGVIYIAPRFPYPHSEQFMDQRMEGWTAWPPYDIDENAPLSSMVDNLNVEWLFACAADARERYRVLGDKVHIVGHSQGAFLAIACAALHPELVVSYFAYAGYVPDFCIEEKTLAEVKKYDVKAYLAHGVEDNVVAHEESEKAEKAMKDAGVDCVLKLFQNTNHHISNDVESFMKEWLNTEVRAIKE